ncbi:dihydropteroate synthase [Altererythrobacter sp. B11]|uniref:dihydropteroate synthase n=1 Tax=Altererythrobacter sp. B11 TaxID=2060312 RepID=UPI000DC73A64|nr:dihydropteroate synthase [Altererythrobacter sp. B11]BBC73731.1 dihydropteroate synthase [Altererythrobacter sp. B11]
MAEQIYIQPITLVTGPQAVEGDAVRLGGSLAYAREFALLLRRDGRVADRILATASAMAEAIAGLPAHLVEEAQAQWADLARVHASLQLGERVIPLNQPQVMGILNVTPDSFSDGGKFLDDAAEAQAHAGAMLEAGAAIVDVGGESTRPGAAAVWEGDEIRRVVPAIERCVAMGAAVSVDTRRPAVMEAALAAGAHIINDVSALRHDPRSLGFAAASGAPVVLMHAPGDGEDLHSGGAYANVLLDVFDWLRAARDRAVAAGIAREKVILDPGIGFGKSMAENLALLNGLELFHALGQPILLGASRKRMIGALSNEAPAHRRLGGSVALALRGMEAGCQLLRVHDVHDTVQARNVWRGLRDAALTDFGGLPA